MPPGTVGTLAFCRVPWKPWAADTAFPSLRRVRRPKRCLINPFGPFPHSDTLPVVMTHPPRQPSGSRSRSQSADQPQDLLEPVPSAPRRTTLAPIFTSLSRRSATIPRSPRATPGSRPRPPHSCFYRQSRRKVARWRLSGHTMPSTPDSGNRPA